MQLTAPLPFDCVRWLESIRYAQLSLERQGAYVNLLAGCWLGPQCSLPSEIEELRKLSGGLMSGLEELITMFFTPHPLIPTRLTQEELRQDWLRAYKRSLARTQVAEQRWSGKPPDTAVPYVQLHKEPKYRGPDRGGNPRKPVEGYNFLWLSEPEKAFVEGELRKAGLREEFHIKAYAVVDSWFGDNPRKLNESSEHKTRITTWGLREALKIQQDVDRAARAAGRPPEQQRAQIPLFKSTRPSEPRATAQSIPESTRETLQKLLRKVE